MTKRILGINLDRVDVKSSSKNYKDLDILEFSSAFSFDEKGPKHLEVDVGDIALDVLEDGVNEVSDVEFVNFKSDTRGVSSNGPGVDVGISRVDVRGDGNSKNNTPKIAFLASGDSSVDCFYDSNAGEWVVDYSSTDTTTSDTRTDVYVDGSFIENDVDDLDIKSGNAITASGSSPSFGDADVTISVDETDINHSNLIGSSDSDAHHTRPSAGTALTETSNTFNVDETAITVENLRTDSTSSGDVLQADGANGLTMAGLAHSDLSGIASNDHHTKPTTGTGLNGTDTFNVDDPLSLSQLNVATIEAQSGSAITMQASGGGASSIIGPNSIQSTAGAHIQFVSSDEVRFAENGSTGSGLGVTLGNVQQIDGVGGATLIATNKDYFIMDSGQSILGENVPYSHVWFDGGGSSVFAEHGEFISGVSGGNGSYTVSTSLSGSVSAQVSVNDIGSNQMWSPRWNVSSGDITIETHRLEYDGSGNVTDVSLAEPDSITVTVFSK